MQSRTIGSGSLLVKLMACSLMGAFLLLASVFDSNITAVLLIWDLLNTRNSGHLLHAGPRPEYLEFHSNPTAAGK